MENENAVEYNMKKGILFAFIGMMIGIVIWLATIVIFRLGTYGVVDGILAAILGILVASGYQKGLGKPTIIGLILVALMTALATIVMHLLSATFLIYHGGMEASMCEALATLLRSLSRDNRCPTCPTIFFRELAIGIAISTVTVVVSLVGKKRDKLMD